MARKEKVVNKVRLVQDLCRIYSENRRLFTGITIGERGNKLNKFCDNNKSEFFNAYIEWIWKGCSNRQKLFSCIHAISRVVLEESDKAERN